VPKGRHFQTANTLSSCRQGFRVDAIVTIDSKGQMVIPKDLREKADLKPNDKLAIVTFEKEGEICCILMIKAERLDGEIHKTLGSMFRELSIKL